MTTVATTLQSRDAGILGRIFPGQIDNKFRGHWFALWLFGFYVFVKLFQGAESAFNSYATATTADGIPLSSYSPAAAQTVLSMFALLGLNVLVLPSLGVVALIRYRAMIPLIYLTMLLLNLGGKALQFVQSAEKAGGVQPIGYYVNLFLLAVLVVGFALSLAKSPAPTDAMDNN